MRCTRPGAQDRLRLAFNPAGVAALRDASHRVGFPANPMLATYGANVLKGWLRAHPEVARLHHPELVQ